MTRDSTPAVVGERRTYNCRMFYSFIFLLFRIFCGSSGECADRHAGDGVPQLYDEQGDLLVIIIASDKIFANLKKLRSKIFILPKDVYFLLIKNKVFAVQVVLTMVNQNLHTVLMAGGKEVMRREFEDFSLLDQMYSGFKIL